MYTSDNPPKLPLFLCCPSNDSRSNNARIIALRLATLNMAHGIDDEFTVDLQYSVIRIVWQAESAWLILRVEQIRFGLEALRGPLN